MELCGRVCGFSGFHFPPPEPSEQLPYPALFNVNNPDFKISTLKINYHLELGVGRARFKKIFNFS